MCFNALFSMNNLCENVADFLPQKKKKKDFPMNILAA